jgi:hypothetical protein
VYTYLPDTSFKGLVKINNKQISTTRGAKYESNMLAQHNKYWSGFSYQCAKYALDAGIKNFEVIVVIDNGGSVKDVVTSPDSKDLSCFTKALRKISYPEHDLGVFFAHFYINDMDKWKSL